MNYGLLVFAGLIVAGGAGGAAVLSTWSDNLKQGRIDKFHQHTLHCYDWRDQETVIFRGSDTDYKGGLPLFGGMSLSGTDIKGRPFSIVDDGNWKCREARPEELE